MKRWIRLGAALALAWLVAPTLGGQPQAGTSVEKAFEQLKGYDYGQNRRPLAMLELEIARSTADPKQGRKMAERLAAVLTDAKATLAAKRFACQQLQVLGAETHVPLLAGMLDTAETADMARRAIEAIPGEASAEALRAALARLKGRPLVGVINSLGVRRDAKVTDALAKLLRSSDSDVAAAAALTLGRIGTADAARAITGGGYDAKVLPAVRDATLRCAERLAAAGKTADAKTIYRRLWQSNAGVSWRLAALTGLARACPDEAAPLLVEAFGGEDPLLQAAAANLLTQTPGKAATAAIVEQLSRVDARRRVLLLDSLAARGDASAKDTVATFIDSKDETVRVAAVHTVAALGDASDVARLVALAAGERGPVGQAARVGLERLSGKGIEKRLIDLAAKGDPTTRVQAARAIAARRSPGATPVLLRAAADTNETVRLAALDALAAAGEAGAYPKLVALLTAARATAETAAAQKAVLAVGGRLAGPGDRTGPVMAAMKTAPAGAKPALLRVLGACGGSKALDRVCYHLDAPEPEVRDAAVRVLVNWSDSSAAMPVLQIAKASANRTHRVLAFRGFLRLTKQNPDATARHRMMTLIRPLAATPDTKKMLLAALADVSGPAALEMAKSFLDDPQVKAEAELAVRQITDAKKPKRTGGAAVPAYNKQRSDALKKELAKHAPKDYRLAGYLDCGPDTADGAKGGPTLRQTSGRVHFWPGSERQAHSRFGTVAFDEQEAVFEATGLDPKRSYQIAFTWWDYDHDTRAQSVWAAGKSARFTRLLDKTKLPAGQARSEKPAEKTLPIPRALSAAGAVRIAFRNEASPNAVVSELWLWESEAQSPPPAAAGGKPQPNSKPPMPQVKPSTKTTKASTRILIVTGIDYPGHKWRKTTPVLTEAIEKDPRLAVDVVEDPNFLASPRIHEYAAIVHHWMNWKTPAPGPAARENFRKFVNGGGGLVVVHFGCGAFQDWPEFVKIAGRVWDPKLRGHDPHGPFRVEIADLGHPITRGMKPFDTDDELYTCLAGEVPIDVLATARSKVDKKVYPIAFVLTCGKGRVFHSVLGHDVKALASPPVGELFRRASAWAAGLPPVAKSK